MNNTHIYNILFLAFSLLVSIFAMADSQTDDYMDIWYAQQFKISLHEAKRRNYVSSIASKIATVFDREKALFSGMIIKNDSPYKIIFEVKRFKHCANIIHTPRFKKDKRCNIVTRIKNKLQAAKIADQVEVVFVKHSKLDQQKLQNKATYYANRYAKNRWSTIGWNPNTHKIEISVLNKENFENELLAANIFLPPEIVITKSSGLLYLH